MSNLRKKYHQKCPYCKNEIDPILIQSISKNINYGIKENIWIMGCPECRKIFYDYSIPEPYDMIKKNRI